MFRFKDSKVNWDQGFCSMLENLAQCVYSAKFGYRQIVKGDGKVGNKFDIRLAQPEDTQDIIFLLTDTKKRMKEQDWLCIDGNDNEDYIRSHMGKDGFILVAEDYRGIDACLVVHYPKPTDADNLGKDIRLAKSEMNKVAHMEIAVVASDCRGAGLQVKLMRKAEDVLSVMHYKYYMCTVHPDNKPCMINLRLLGYKRESTKYKYGGLPRNIMLKMR